MCEDWVPHEGQDAMGDVVCKVRVISSATSTPSTWTSGRSRKMIIGFSWFLEKVSIYEKMFNFLVYHICLQQGCVTTRNYDKRHLASIRENALKSASARQYFWQTVQKKFSALHLSPDHQGVLKAKLLERVPDVAQGEFRASN